MLRDCLIPINNSFFVKIEASHLAGSGVRIRGGDLVMYRRTAFEKQFSFFGEQIIGRGVLGWVLGPPGTGKSATSFAFISTLDKNIWTVLWVHLTKTGYASVIIFDGDEKTRLSCSPYELSILLEGMRHQPSVKNTLLIIDGYVNEVNWHVTALGQAMLWRNQDTFKRRLAVVTSMSSRGKVHVADDEENDVLEFTVFSWTLEEYLKAIDCDEFLQSVKFSLDSIDAADDPSLQEMVEGKFLVAGGCARYMFSMCTSDVKQCIVDAIASLDFSLSASILSAGQRSGKAINRLFNQYQNAAGKTVTTFVSRFAEMEIALLRGPEAVKELFRLIRKFSSGSTAGGLFEAIFFVRMRTDVIPLKCFNGTKITLEASDFEDYDVNMETISYADRRLWLRPVSDTQIGFDAVYIDKDAKFARFFQLARGKTHSFKMDGCMVLLNKLEDCKVEVVEFCFVVRDSLLYKFRISGGKQITGRGCLSDYKVAGKEEKWKKGFEETDAVILGMDDII